MRRARLHPLTVAAAVFASLLLALPPAHAATPALIPIPASIQPGEGDFTVASGAVIVTPAGDAQALFAAQEVARLAAQGRGLALAVRPGNDEGAIRLVLDPKAKTGPEGYVLTVTRKGVAIRSAGEAGLFYGAMTLVQLLTPADSFRSAPGTPVTLKAMTIQDQPRFAWRGLLLDVARHFQPVDAVKTTLDAMASQKLNVFHWHLTDDQGWRLEIKRYPLLTQIGAWRTPPTVGADDGHVARYGGFYTQAEVREIVAYAAARHITVLPEIDMPGHAQALVAAYPEVGVTGTRPEVSVDWGVNPYLLNVDPPSLAFIHNVLDEVMALFPSTYIHVGGDEAIKTQWRASPAIQAKMKALGITSEDALQSWFIEGLGQYLQAHGRRLIGWDEILEGGLPPSASVMSWRGAQGAVTAAGADHDVVLAPLYLDNQQTNRADEPQGRIGNLPLSAAYGVDVSPKGIAPAMMHHVLGLEGALWTEYLTGPWNVNHAAYPRLAAVAETAWSPEAARSFPSFLARLPAELTRYRRMGIDSADGAFAPDFEIANGRNAALAEGRATVSLTNQVRFGDLHYTLDGSPPTMASPVFTAPITAPLGARIRAATYTPDGEPLAAARTLDLSPAALLTRSSADLEGCPNYELGLRVPLNPDASAKAPVFDVNLLNACWIYPKARLSGVSAIEVAAARLPRNYGLADEAKNVVAHPMVTPHGELSVRGGSCKGPVVATLPLPDPAAHPDVHLSLKGPLSPLVGEQDLCLIFTAPITGPLYAVDKVSLVAGGM